MDFTKISCKYVRIPVSATLADGTSAELTGIDVALLAPNWYPTADTAWTAAQYADGEAVILVAGPDADATDALILAESSDLWIRVADIPEVDAVKAGRLDLR